jgi:ferredoxin-type protein NapG
MAEESPYGRRQFLKDSVGALVRTAHAYAKERDAPIDAPRPSAREDWLRPPGAVDEALFTERCTRCGDCLKACPYGSIVPEPHSGLPVVWADQKPCYLCDDFPCIAACATEALLPVEDRTKVSMGGAVVSYRACTAGQGCHACVSKCLVTALSMDFDSFRLVVQADRCVGCGICEYTCKTVNDTLAIKVIPSRVR